MSDDKNNVSQQQPETPTTNEANDDNDTKIMRKTRSLRWKAPQQLQPSQRKQQTVKTCNESGHK